MVEGPVINESTKKTALPDEKLNENGAREKELGTSTNLAENKESSSNLDGPASEDDQRGALERMRESGIGKPEVNSKKQNDSSENKPTLTGLRNSLLAAEVLLKTMLQIPGQDTRPAPPKFEDPFGGTVETGSRLTPERVAELISKGKIDPKDPEVLAETKKLFGGMKVLPTEETLIKNMCIEIGGATMTAAQLQELFALHKPDGPARAPAPSSERPRPAPSAAPVEPFDWTAPGQVTKPEDILQALKDKDPSFLLRAENTLKDKDVERLIADEKYRNNNSDLLRFFNIKDTSASSMETFIKMLQAVSDARTGVSGTKSGTAGSADASTSGPLDIEKMTFDQIAKYPKETVIAALDPTLGPIFAQIKATGKNVDPKNSSDAQLLADALKAAGGDDKKLGFLMKYYQDNKKPLEPSVWDKVKDGWSSMASWNSMIYDKTGIPGWVATLGYIPTAYAYDRFVLEKIANSGKYLPKLAHVMRVLPLPPAPFPLVGRVAGAWIKEGVIWGAGKAEREFNLSQQSWRRPDPHNEKKVEEFEKKRYDALFQARAKGPHAELAVFLDSTMTDFVSTNKGDLTDSRPVTYKSFVDWLKKDSEVQKSDGSWKDVNTGSYRAGHWAPFLTPAARNLYHDYVSRMEKDRASKKAGDAWMKTARESPTSDGGWESVNDYTKNFLARKIKEECIIMGKNAGWDWPDVQDHLKDLKKGITGREKDAIEKVEKEVKEQKEGAAGEPSKTFSDWAKVVEKESAGATDKASEIKRPTKAEFKHALMVNYFHNGLNMDIPTHTKEGWDPLIKHLNDHAETFAEDKEDDRLSEDERDAIKEQHDAILELKNEFQAAKAKADKLPPDQGSPLEHLAVKLDPNPLARQRFVAYIFKDLGKTTRLKNDCDSYSIAIEKVNERLADMRATGVPEEQVRNIEGVFLEALNKASNTEPAARLVPNESIRDCFMRLHKQSLAYSEAFKEQSDDFKDPAKDLSERNVRALEKYYARRFELNPSTEGRKGKQGLDLTAKEIRDQIMRDCIKKDKDGEPVLVDPTDPKKGYEILDDKKCLHKALNNLADRLEKVSGIRDNKDIQVREILYQARTSITDRPAWTVMHQMPGTSDYVRYDLAFNGGECDHINTTRPDGSTERLEIKDFKKEMAEFRAAAGDKEGAKSISDMGVPEFKRMLEGRGRGYEGGGGGRGSQLIVARWLFGVACSGAAVVLATPHMKACVNTSRGLSPSSAGPEG